MKSGFFCFVFLLILTFTFAIVEKGLFAMGSDGKVIKQQMKEKDDEQGKNPDDMNNEGKHSITNGKDDMIDKPPTEKKHRLKYLDPYECPC